MTPKADLQYLLAQLQLVVQSHYPQEHQLELVTHLTVGLLHQLVAAQSHLHTRTHKQQTSHFMRSGHLLRRI
jgi:hypothetical protein